jgi:hypothetical protein
MKNNIEQIIDIFNQYPNYFEIIMDSNSKTFRDKFNFNEILCICDIFHIIPDELYFYPQFVHSLSNELKLDDFFDTTNNYKIIINKNFAYIDRKNIKIKNIIKKVENFIKEFEKRYKLYNYLKYKNAIEEL